MLQEIFFSKITFPTLGALKGLLSSVLPGDTQAESPRYCRPDSTALLPLAWVRKGLHEIQPRVRVWGLRRLCSARNALAATAAGPTSCLFRCLKQLLEELCSLRSSVCTGRAERSSHSLPQRQHPHSHPQGLESTLGKPPATPPADPAAPKSTSTPRRSLPCLLQAQPPQPPLVPPNSC